MVVKENDLLVTEYGHHEFVEGAEVSLDGVVGVPQALEVDKVADKVVLGRLLAGLELLPLAELAPRLLVRLLAKSRRTASGAAEASPTPLRLQEKRVKSG